MKSDLENVILFPLISDLPDIPEGILQSPVSKKIEL